VLVMRACCTVDTVTADELREVRRRRQQWHKA